MLLLQRRRLHRSKLLNRVEVDRLRNCRSWPLGPLPPSPLGTLYSASGYPLSTFPNVHDPPQFAAQHSIRRVRVCPFATEFGFDSRSFEDTNPQRRRAATWMPAISRRTSNPWILHPFPSWTLQSPLPCFALIHHRFPNPLPFS